MTRLYRVRPSIDAAHNNHRFALTGSGSLKVQGHDTTYLTTPTEFNNIGAREGDLIVQVVGKFVRARATKKAKPFDIGKVYKNNDGSERTVIGFLPDGRVLAVTCEEASDAMMYYADGKRVGTVHYHGYNLVPEYEEVAGELVIEEVKE